MLVPKKSYILFNSKRGEKKGREKKVRRRNEGRKKK